MSQKEVKRFTEDVAKSQQLVSGLEKCGTDVSKIASLANVLGYEITEEDLNNYQNNLVVLGNTKTIDENVRGTIIITIG